MTNNEILDLFIRNFDIRDFGTDDPTHTLLHIKPRVDDWNGERGSKSMLLKIPKRVEHLQAV